VLHEAQAGPYLKYIKHVLDHHQIRLVHPPEAAADPVERIEQAARERAASRAKAYVIDQSWCVFIGRDAGDLRDARAIAESRGVQVASVYPSFDLWLLLHFVDAPHDPSPEGIARELATYLGSPTDLSPLAGRFELAEKRAATLSLTEKNVQMELPELVRAVEKSMFNFGGAPRGQL
jgi:hypothetical protein